MMHVLQRAGSLTLDLVFPPRCALCNRAGTMLCLACVRDLPKADGRRCQRCWAPIARDSLCRFCAREAPAFTSLRAAFIMRDGARKLVHALKYDGLTALAAPMASLFEPQALQSLADIVVPVPLHRSRERSRGFNQAACLARHVAPACGLRVELRACRRTRPTPPQVRAMSREERRANVSGAFSARSDAVHGLRVLLLDDVTTTGATLDACALALREAGARSVRCIVWARED